MHVQLVVDVSLFLALRICWFPGYDYDTNSTWSLLVRWNLNYTSVRWILILTCYSIIEMILVYIWEKNEFSDFLEIEKQTNSNTKTQRISRQDIFPSKLHHYVILTELPCNQNFSFRTNFSFQVNYINL